MISPNVETFIGCDSSYRAADIVLYGAPFDSTTSYRPGARFGPSAIRHESFGLETYSPYQNADLTDFDIFDSGDLELCFGSSEAALADIEARAAEILHDGKLPLLLGGEHLVTLGAVRAVAEKYPGLHIIHFDAHADLRDDYLGAKLSHACVLRRCHEIVGDGRPTDLILFGVSLGLSAAFLFARGWAVVAVYAGLTFCYSALAAVLPALSTDLFGLPHAGVNYGFLALGQSVGSLLFPCIADFWGFEQGRHILAIAGAAAGFACIWAVTPVRREPQKKPN